MGCSLGILGVGKGNVLSGVPGTSATFQKTAGVVGQNIVPRARDAVWGCWACSKWSWHAEARV